MSTFEVPTLLVAKVEDHPGADRLSLVYVRDFITISAKLEDGSHRYAPGEQVVYIPEGAVVPEELLKEIGFWDEAKGKGALAGSKGDRVKAISLRGVLSQGIIFKWTEMAFTEGYDVASALGITKYEPPIPTCMSGEVFNVGMEHSFNYDIENLKKYPDLLDGLEVMVSEKIHGTFCAVCYVKGLNHPDAYEGDYFVASKGMLAKGQAFKWTEENVRKNLYLRTVGFQGIIQKLKKYVNTTNATGAYLFGEVFGPGVQDLHYGVKEPMFRAFDIMVDGFFLDERKYEAFEKWIDVEAVPYLWKGVFDRTVIDSFCRGNTMLSADSNILEGVVITPTKEQRSPLIGRLFLKHLSEAYLLRKGNATEFN